MKYIISNAVLLVQSQVQYILIVVHIIIIIKIFIYIQIYLLLFFFLCRAYDWPCKCSLTPSMSEVVFRASLST